MKTITEQLQLIKQQNRLGLMTHVVMGYPSLTDTRERILRMVEAGVDIIELQIPFSDPIADGPAITQANQQAVASGVTVEQCLALVAELSPQINIPLQFIGYYNTVLHYGVEEFVHASSVAGIQGFTFPDLPYEEEPYEHMYAAAKQAKIPMIQLVTPTTTTERLQQITSIAEGLLYCVARTGTTGTSTIIDPQLIAYLQRLRQYVTIPLAVGFGLSTREQLQALRPYADVAVIGSALLKIPTNSLTDYITNLLNYAPNRSYQK